MAKTKGHILTTRKATDATRAAFLAAFRVTGIIRAAAEAAGVCRQQHYQWLDKCPDYREAFALVEQDACDIMEERAHQIAMDGLTETSVEQKIVDGVVTETTKKVAKKYWPSMLMFMLKSRNPKFNDRLDARVAFAGRVELTLGEPREGSGLTYADLLAGRTTPAAPEVKVAKLNGKRKDGNK